MKLIVWVFAIAFLSACTTTGSDINHEDSEAGADHDAGPSLCRDGTPPPCTIRQ